MSDNNNHQIEEVKEKKLKIDFQQPKSISDPFLTISRKKIENNSESSDKIVTQTYLVSICHRIPERSIHFRGQPILCYRCTGTYVGLGILLLYQLIGIIFGFSLLAGPLRLWFLRITGNSLWSQITFTVLLILPMVIDGGNQAAKNTYVSTNPKRFITGLLAGFGIFSFFLVLGTIFLYLK